MKPIQHEVILQDATGRRWQGVVVSHLPLPLWYEQHGYQLQQWEGFHPALPGQRTHLMPQEAT